MRAQEFMEVMATWADAEARSTAELTELLVAACLKKLAPPEGEAVASITLTDADLNDLQHNFYFDTRYENGEMKLFLTRIIKPEVTSEPLTKPDDS